MDGGATGGGCDPEELHMLPGNSPSNLVRRERKMNHLMGGGARVRDQNVFGVRNSFSS